ncbi:hypothetical protein NC653_031678 [Populus alba x Populus x berolinensis]|uniref:Uncharacterized protein n=1 Tax=Populus alba x Populus x berolinensis TaxID=444605 RepID=A0AAD6LZD1_9ROSI|nr:hypothetical protein NC653_031678 [Populus alba x Populus x berolinensis]
MGLFSNICLDFFLFNIFLSKATCLWDIL